MGVGGRRGGVRKERGSYRLQQPSEWREEAKRTPQVEDGAQMRSEVLHELNALSGRCSVVGFRGVDTARAASASAAVRTLHRWLQRGQGDPARVINTLWRSILILPVITQLREGSPLASSSRT